MFLSSEIKLSADLALMKLLGEDKDKDKEKDKDKNKDKDKVNKLAKARKMRKPPGTLGLKKFGPGKFWVKKVWAQRKLKKN